MKRHWKVATGIVAVTSLAVGGGSVFAQMSNGPSKDKPLLILAEVERRTLEDSATLTGTLAREEQRKITAVSQGRVSAVDVQDGADVQAGESLLAIDGRPAIAVNGTTHFFRTLDVGNRGEDVLQLERVLDAAGHNPGTVDTVYTEQTRFALAQWQSEHLYPGAVPVTAQSVTVSLAAAGTSSYTVGPQSSAGLIIGPSAPARSGALRRPLRVPSSWQGTTRPALRRITTPLGARPFAPVVPSITIESSAAAVSEGGIATFVIRASESSASAIDINLTVGGDADSTDIVTPSSIVTLAADTTTANVSVATRADTVVELNKTLTLSVASGADYDVGSPSSASTTIVDANVPELHLSGGVTVTEGGSTTLTVTADQAPVTDTQVVLGVGGDAQVGNDYRSFDPTLVLQAGDTSATVRIATLTNDTLQPTRHIVVSISQSTSYTIGSPTTSVVTIAADTTLPTVTLRSATTYLAKGQPYTLTIGLSQALTENLPVVLSFSGSAEEGRDFAAPSGPVTIPAGQTSLTVQVATVGDNVVQADRELTVSIGASDRYAIGDPNTASVTITSQVVPELSITASTNSLSFGGAATFTISADQAPVEDTSVNYQIVGSAQPGKDFEPLLGTVLLRRGERSVTVTLRSINKDVLFSPTDMIVADWPVRVGQVLVKEGDSVPPGAALLSLTDPNFTVTLKANASDRTKLDVGQSCKVKLTGGDDEASGTISQLDETVTVDDQTKEESYEGKIDVPDLGAADGASVTIDCVVKERKNALTVPIAAVKQNGEGEDVVRVIDLSKNGQITEVRVKTGLSEGSYIEVTSGLKGHETVIVEVDQTR